VAKLPLSSRTSGPQVRRDDRDDVQDHPLRAVLAAADRLDQLEPLDDLLGLLPGASGRELRAQLLGERGEVEAVEQLADRLRAHVRLEAVAVAVPRLAVLLLGEELLRLERRVTGSTTT
jgi:hypothetical protein